MIHSDQFRKCAFLFIHINVANIILFLVSFQNFVYIYTIICLYTSIFFHFTQSNIDFRPRFDRFLLLIQLEQEICVFVTDELKLKKKDIQKMASSENSSQKRDNTIRLFQFLYFYSTHHFNSFNVFRIQNFRLQIPTLYPRSYQYIHTVKPINWSENTISFQLSLNNYYHSNRKSLLM